MSRLFLDTKSRLFLLLGMVLGQQGFAAIIEVKTPGGKLIKIEGSQVSSCQITQGPTMGWSKPPLKLVANGKIYWTSQTNRAGIRVKCKLASSVAKKAPIKKTPAKKLPSKSVTGSTKSHTASRTQSPAPRFVKREVPDEAPVVEQETQVGDVEMPNAKIMSSAYTPKLNASHEEDLNRWDGETEIYGDFTVQTFPKLDPFDRVILPEKLRMRLIYPTEPSPLNSWYEVGIEDKGFQGEGQHYYIDAHSLNLMLNSPGIQQYSDGSYEFSPAEIESMPRTIDVISEGANTAFELNDLAYVDPQSKSDWGGVLAVTKDGRRGYTSPVNLPKLDGVPLIIEAPKVSRNVVVPEEEVQPASSSISNEQLMPAEHVHGFNVSSSRVFPKDFEKRLREQKSVSFKGGKDPGFGHIDPDISQSLKVGSKWSVKPVCRLYDEEICRGFAVNDDPSPSRDEFLLVKAIMYHESHTDNTSFRYEKRFENPSKTPSWIKMGWKKYKANSPNYMANSGDDLHFRQFHSSYGLIHVFLPALSQWYPDDSDWKARPGGPADIREVVEHPARLLDPTTNLIWGIRIVKNNYALSKNLKGNKNKDIGLIRGMAAAYNGGPGSLKSRPPAVSAVACRPGIDPDCSREGSRKLPYYESLENVVNEMKRSCGIAANPCGGR